MGTHPIFESDFDCLTEFERMKLFKTGLLMLAVVALAVNADEEFDSEVEDGVEVEDEGEIGEEAGEGTIIEADEAEEEEADDEGTGAPHVDITSYFPEAQVSAGKVSEVLVSVKVDKEAVDTFTFLMIDGGFHYPQDWGYKVQNFSSIRYTRELSAGEEATFMYPFMAAELAGGRSYGLQLNLHYMNDAPQPQVFTEAFYNSTVEVAENMDNAVAEQLFMMLTLVVVGGLVFAYFAAKVSPKKSVKAAAVETGTGDAADVSWIPKEHQKKTGSATQSPTARRRKAD